jgi:hypothetical protein
MGVGLRFASWQREKCVRPLSQPVHPPTVASPWLTPLQPVCAAGAGLTCVSTAPSFTTATAATAAGRAPMSSVAPAAAPVATAPPGGPPGSAHCTVIHHRHRRHCRRQSPHVERRTRRSAGSYRAARRPPGSARRTVIHHRRHCRRQSPHVERRTRRSAGSYRAARRPPGSAHRTIIHHRHRRHCRWQSPHVECLTRRSAGSYRVARRPPGSAHRTVIHHRHRRHCRWQSPHVERLTRRSAGRCRAARRPPGSAHRTGLRHSKWNRSSHDRPGRANGCGLGAGAGVGLARVLPAPVTRPLAAAAARVQHVRARACVRGGHANAPQCGERCGAMSHIATSTQRSRTSHWASGGFTGRRLSLHLEKPHARVHARSCPPTVTTMPRPCHVIAPRLRCNPTMQAHTGRHGDGGAARDCVTGGYRTATSRAAPACAAPGCCPSWPDAPQCRGRHAHGRRPRWEGVVGVAGVWRSETPTATR